MSVYECKAGHLPDINSCHHRLAFIASDSTLATGQVPAAIGQSRPDQPDRGGWLELHHRLLRTNQLRASGVLGNRRLCDGPRNDERNIVLARPSISCHRYRLVQSFAWHSHIEAAGLLPGHGNHRVWGNRAAGAHSLGACDRRHLRLTRCTWGFYCRAPDNRQPSAVLLSIGMVCAGTGSGAAGKGLQTWSRHDRLARLGDCR